MTMKIHEETLDKKKIKLIGFISFFMGFAQAVTAYILSSYFKEALGTENVGIFYSLAYVVVFIILLNFHKIIKRFGKSNAFFFTLIIKLVTLAFLATMQPSWWSIGLLVAYIITAQINWVVLDIILESFSVDNRSGRIRGVHWMIIDAGFLLGPILSTQILERYNFQIVFLISLIIECLVIFLAVEGFKRINHKFEGRVTIKELINKVIKKKNILRIYYISFILEFFYAIMVIYVPFYLRDLGISWEQIGYIFTVMLIPFVIFPIPVGYLADKYLGEKEMLIGSIILMGISTLLVYFTVTLSIYAWAGILFMTRIGASIIQTLRDSYFYKRIDGRDVDIIDFYRTSIPAAYILASMISALILLFFPLKMMFFVLALVIFSSLYPAFQIIDNKGEKESLVESK